MDREPLGRKSVDAVVPSLPLTRRASACGLLFMLAASTLWSFIGVFSRYCLEAGMSPLMCAFMRAACGGGAFLAHCALAGRLKIPLRHVCIFVLFGAWSVGVYFTAFQVAVKLSGASMVIILECTAPFWVALFARLFFKERLTLLKLCSMVAAAGGISLVCLSGGALPGGLPLGGLLAGLLSGFCYSTYYPFTRYWQGRYPTVVIYSWMMLGGAVALLATMSLAPFPQRLSFAPSVWAVAATTGFACTYLAYLSYGEALKRVSLVGAAVASELEPVLTVLWAWAAFGECFAPLGWLGSVVVVASVLSIALLPQDG